MYESTCIQGKFQSDVFYLYLTKSSTVCLIRKFCSNFAEWLFLFLCGLAPGLINKIHFRVIMLTFKIVVTLVPYLFPVECHKEASNGHCILFVTNVHIILSLVNSLDNI